MAKRRQLRGFDLKQIEGVAGLIGVDEAGRGALAGPVVAGAVLVTKEFLDGRWATTKAGSPRPCAIGAYSGHNGQSARAADVRRPAAISISNGQALCREASAEPWISGFGRNISLCRLRAALVCPWPQC